MSKCRHDVEQDCPACMQEEIDDLTKANQLLQAFIGNRDKEVDRLRTVLANIEAISVCVGVVDPAQHENMLSNIARVARESRTSQMSRAGERGK